MRVVREAASREGLQQTPGIVVSCVCPARIPQEVESTKKKSKHLGHYDTPTELGEKWQMDVKYVPAVCYVGTDGEKFYQYTMVEEASRERFIYAYKEASSYSTVDFVQRAIISLVMRQT